MQQETDKEQSPIKKKRRVPAWLKWIIGIIVGIVALIAALITGIVLILNPERLTPLVEKKAPEFINGEIKASRIELTFWSTFPRFTLDVDSLLLVSHALDSVDDSIRRQLPQWTDTLLQMDRFHGSINLHKLFAGAVEIYDVEIDRPAANIVVVNDSVANYNLTEPSADDSSSSVSSFSIERFALVNSGPLRYYSVPDSSLYTATLNTIELDGKASPAYTLNTDGEAWASMLQAFNLPPISFAFDGALTFDFNNGLSAVNVDKLRLNVGDLAAYISTSVQLTDTITVNSLVLDLPKVTYADVKPLLGEEMLKELRTLDTDMAVTLKAVLTKPYRYVPGSITIPWMNVDLDIPQCHVQIPSRRLAINRFILQAKATVNGENLNASKLEIPRLFIDGRAIDLDLKGTVTSPLNNPRIAGEVKGRIEIDKLPPVLLQQLPARIGGTIGLSTDFRLRQNQLTRNGFHKIYAKGTVSLREISLSYVVPGDSLTPPDTTRLYTPLTMLRFSSDTSVETNGVKVDSLLTLNLTSDSLFYHGEGMDIKISRLEAGLGSRNVSQSADTTQINPFGGRITIGRLRLLSQVDTMRLNLSDAVINGSLSRFEADGKVPLLKLSTEARRMSMATPDGRLSINRPNFSFTANMIKRQPRQRNTDSIGTPRRRHAAAVDQTHEDSVRTGLRQLLRRWNVRGQFTTSRARLFTPKFPLQNTLSNIDLTFTTDSINLRSLQLQAGVSDFRIRGTVTGLKQSVSRRNKKPLKVNFTLVSDTIDIDELSRAIFAGAAAERDTSLLTASTDANTDIADVINVDTTATGPLLVSNDIDASLMFTARNVIYSNILMHSFKGELGMWDGAIHLHNLIASSDVGKIALSALYNAPDVNDLEFGMGMQLLDFHIEKFIQIVPSVNELLPAIKDFSGIINSDIALTTKLDPDMNFDIPSLQADLKIDGDSLVLLDADTFKSLSKWLLFKNKKRNMIDHMSVQVQVDSSQIVLFPFIFNIDRYKLGVMGSNDLNMNLNYHVSVLKSPIPFKFGINISGNIDKMKIRLGGAKIKENTVVERVAINSDTRINLVNQLEGIFRRGANASRQGRSTGSVHLGQQRNQVLDELDAPTDSLTLGQTLTLEGETNGATTIGEAAN